MSIPAPGDTRKAGCQIMFGLADPEQEAEQGTQMRRRRRVSKRPRPEQDLAKEGNEIVRRDGVEITKLGAKAECHEAIKEVQTILDRRLGQSPLYLQIGLVLRAQAITRSRTSPRRIRAFGNTGFDKIIDEPVDAERFVGVFVVSIALENRSTNF